MQVAVGKPTIISALAAAAMFSSVSVGQAEVQVQEEQFRDWVHRCELETELNAVKCFIYTGRGETLPDGTQHSVNIIVGLVGPDLIPLVYVEVPDIASPERGVQVQIDTNEPLNGRFAACNIGWCQTVAGGEVAEMMVTQFRAGAQATVRFFLEDNETLLQVPMSLFGFTAAYTMLQENMTTAVADLEAAAAAAAEAEAEASGADDSTDTTDATGEDSDGAAPADDVSSDDTAPEDGAPDDGASADMPADDAASDADGMVEDGTVEDGAVDDGAGTPE